MHLVVDTLRLATDTQRTSYGLVMDGERATHGRYTGGGVERFACRAGREGRSVRGGVLSFVGSCI